MSANPELKFESRDEFQRRKIAEKVIKLLKSEISVSPMVIDGTWGLGKTEFCHKLIDLMQEEDCHELIYIDAFKADHANEPLLTVLAEVVKSLPDDNQRNNLIQKALPALRYSLKAGAKAVVSHLLKQDVADVVEGFEQEVQQVTDKAIDTSVESLLKDHVDAEKNLEALRKSLATVTADKPLVIFIDELDRCRPDFAVLMLETIKHTFDVEGVQFVLVTNTEQLKASINHCYGPTIDAQRYLDKFLKFSFTLPSTIRNYNYETRLASAQHYINQILHSPILKDSGLERDSYLALMERIIEVNKISLREVETFVRHLEIYQMLSDEDPLGNKVWSYKLLRLLGISLYCFNPELAKETVGNKLDAKRLGEFLLLQGELPALDQNGHYPEYADIILFALSKECKFNVDFYNSSNSELETKWQSLAEQIFEDRYWISKGERLKVVIEAVISLGLTESR
ncbi:KAP family NTPase [Shewanella corallii]|uniref:KAP family NTPase n=1 Tax=Shewanella corallii TaxID=560080 RepID=A0ABT0NCB9_9GAMM|nr:KAP family NTPase [Shewanella corallii]MCL2916121.1 KAP family NTPase [Shewanella corallii]